MCVGGTERLTVGLWRWVFDQGGRLEVGRWRKKLDQRKKVEKEEGKEE